MHPMGTVFSSKNESFFKLTYSFIKYPDNELPSLYDIEKEHLWLAPHLLVTKLHKSVPH